MPILDYQTQQHKLFPGIAAAYAFKFVSLRLEKMYLENEAKLQKMDFTFLPEVSSLISFLVLDTLAWIHTGVLSQTMVPIVVQCFLES